MKVMLTILCAIMVLFAGGCALLLLLSPGGTGMFLSGAAYALIPGVVAALNGAVISALWGSATVGRPVFVTLVVLDAIVVALASFGWIATGFADRDMNVMSALFVGGFGLKGYLTYLVAPRPS